MATIRHNEECPHVRGGVPTTSYLSRAYSIMSPRAWGCTRLLTTLPAADNNVPTCVGVYRLRGARRAIRQQCPHVRGGVPFAQSFLSAFRTMSPRAWGCTVQINMSRLCHFNVPTCVGVYRSASSVSMLCCECPHVRGGIPLNPWPPVLCVTISPTCVGVYRKLNRALSTNQGNCLYRRTNHDPDAVRFLEDMLCHTAT